MGTWSANNTASSWSSATTINIPVIYVAASAPEDPGETTEDAKAELRRQHRIDMIDVGRELRLSHEVVLHARRSLAFGLEPPPYQRVREHVSPPPRAPPGVGRRMAARSKAFCILIA